VGPWVSHFRERRFEKRGCGAFVATLPKLTRAISIFSLAGLLAAGACAPKVSIGEWQCSAQDGGADDGASPASKTDPVPVPWSNGFEDGFCDYQTPDGPGYCYGDKPYVLVTEPHRPGGQFAAEFKVIGDQQNQTRCVRQGELPESAYYGAWYFIPEALQSVTVWDLWHFTAGDPSSPNLPGLWDVRLSKIGTSGDWELVVFDPLAPVNNQTYQGPDHKPVPIGSWFHIELFLKRASDSTGEVRLYQDGALLFDQTNLKSDASKFSQWYVGDWASGPTPLDSSLYVDDISIGATLSSATP
jgi:hypothetical protein